MLLRPTRRQRREDGLRQARHQRQGDRDRHRLLHAGGQEARSGVPAMLAGLVTNDKADILATAYAPAEPDYAKASPFESLLAGRAPQRRPLHSADGQGRPCLDEQAAAGQRLLQGGAEMPCQRASISRRAAKACAARRPSRRSSSTASAIRPIRTRSAASSTRTTTGATAASSPSPATASRTASPARRTTRWPRKSPWRSPPARSSFPRSASSTHYYANYVSPRWARTMQKMKKIGLHIFYRTYGGGWS